MNEKAKELFNKIDALPLVRIMQVAAVLMFILGIIGWLAMVPKYFDLNYNNTTQFLGGLQSTAMTLVQILYHPVILLGLAEIIKILKARK